MKSEASIQRQILAFLKSKGAYAVKVEAANRRGVPDILCCFKSRFLAIETKTEKGVISDIQLCHRDFIDLAQGIHIFATSVERVEDELRKRGLM